MTLSVICNKIWFMIIHQISWIPIHSLFISHEVCVLPERRLREFSCHVVSFFWGRFTYSVTMPFTWLHSHLYKSLWLNDEVESEDLVLPHSMVHSQWRVPPASNIMTNYIWSYNRWHCDIQPLLLASSIICSYMIYRFKQTKFEVEVLLFFFSYLSFSIDRFQEALLVDQHRTWFLQTFHKWVPSSLVYDKLWNILLWSDESIPFWNITCSVCIGLGI